VRKLIRLRLSQRTFGIGRVIDAPQRGAQSCEIFSNKIKLRVNQVILESMLEEQIQVVKHIKESKWTVETLRLGHR
jgi:hypothetical protein